MKLNKKGFTLVELIVVMAIIAVLAAILVPTMLGFMNNAKYTQANANAKTVYTAVNSVVADHCTDNSALDASDTATISSADLQCAFTDKTFDMKNFLEGMTGKAYVVLNSTGTGVDYVRWSLGDPSTATAGLTEGKVSKAAQKDGTAIDGTNNPLGGYPLAA